MITARNYAAQAINGLKEYVSGFYKTGFVNDCKKLRVIIDMMEGSQHFVMPDGGLIMDDDMRGIIGNEIRLPYQSITIEYYKNKIIPMRDGGEARYIKSVILAFEDDKGKWDNLFDLEYSKSDKVIIVIGCNYINDMWYPSLSSMAIPCDWDNTSLLSVFGDEQGSNNAIQFAAAPKLMFVDTFNHLFGYGCNKEQALNDSYREIANEARVVFELCEALSCSNIEQTVFNQCANNNGKRIRQGKLPVYETKYLTVKQKNVKSTKAASRFDVDRNAPRRHLRRGHIRRLPDKNVWVNSCVVGHSSIGVIDKKYIVS